MEETGTISYWSVLFKATSFSDLLSRIDSIHEVAEADQRMLDELERHRPGDRGRPPGSGGRSWRRRRRPRPPLAEQEKPRWRPSASEADA